MSPGQPVTPHEQRADRPADEAARDDASHRRRHRHGRRARDASLLEQGCEGQPGGRLPVKVTDPFSTPKSGCCPRSVASPAPITFCTMASTEHSNVKISTCGPPTFSNDRLAPKPMVVKKAIISGAWRRVSKVRSVTPCARAAVTATATSSPPMTGAGTL